MTDKVSAANIFMSQDSFMRILTHCTLLSCFRMVSVNKDIRAHSIDDNFFAVLCGRWRCFSIRFVNVSSKTCLQINVWIQAVRTNDKVQEREVEGHFYGFVHVPQQICESEFKGHWIPSVHQLFRMRSKFSKGPFSQEEGKECLSGPTRVQLFGAVLQKWILSIWRLITDCSRCSHETECLHRERRCWQ